ncbi:MAG: hypothetical protein INR69_19065 [Mucilaginibacter polytrichastri]|nr:hypothetical protein [Mucilaginibacter polytrichastri]
MTHQAELEAWRLRSLERMRDEQHARQIAAGARHEWSPAEKPAVVPVDDDPLPDYDTPAE